MRITQSSYLEYMSVQISSVMNKPKNRIVPQKNKNNKTKPENLMKKEYLEDYEELKKSITEEQKELERE